MITFTTSLAGRSHLAVGRVNQDSSGVWDFRRGGIEFGGAAACLSVPSDLQRLLAKPVAGDGLALAVADGHGSERYDRSHIGSALAVALALAQCGQLVARLDQQELEAIWIETELPRRFAQQWKRLVLSTRPEDDTSTETEFITRHGTTLISALVGLNSLLLFQIGDGELIVVTNDGEVHRPLPERTVMLGSEVESLSQGDADSAFRAILLPLRREDVRMVMLVTDGVTNSFVEEHGIEQFAVQSLERAKQIAPGGYPLQQVLQRAIARCSSFTGDDVSIAVALNADEGPRKEETKDG